MRIGYFLSSEEWGPHDLIAQAVKAKKASFDGLWISDHFHPWNDKQGHSPFVWSTIGAIAEAAAMSAVLLHRNFLAFGSKSVDLAARIGDGYCTVGPDADSVRRFREGAAYEAAGFDELYINQIGPDQDAFFEAYRDKVLPRL